MRHIDQQVGADLIRDSPKCLPVDDSRISREPGNDHLRRVFLREIPNRMVVNEAAHRIDTVLNGPIELAGEIDLAAVGQVPAVGKAHAEDRIARLEQGHEHGGVSLRTRMGLNIGIVRAE